VRLRALALPVAAILLAVGTAGPVRAEEALDVAADPSTGNARDLADSGPYADLLRWVRPSHDLTASDEQTFDARFLAGVEP
jgi:hypothetical protein